MPKFMIHASAEKLILAFGFKCKLQHTFPLTIKVEQTNEGLGLQFARSCGLGWGCTPVEHLNIQK